MPAPLAGNFGEIHEFIVHNDAGQPVLVVRGETYTVFDANHAATTYHGDRGFELGDGLIWTPQMLQSNHPVYLTVCGTCRNPRVSFFRFQRATHGLLSVRNARTCNGCGRVVCPTHRRLLNRQWFCLACTRFERIKSLIRPIFFREIE